MIPSDLQLESKSLIENAPTVARFLTSFISNSSHLSVAFTLLLSQYTKKARTNRTIKKRIAIQIDTEMLG